ncbi:MAG: allophanate hydrolase [Opitutaceae bacterium]
MNLESLDLHSLQAAYRDGGTPHQLVRVLHARMETRGDDHVWIHRVPLTDLLAQADRVVAEKAAGKKLPLFGVPFAVKDNIDVSGMPTTAACPDFAYVATATSPVVQRLMDSGAILLGKTNLDQFATGLVGVRSPYGAPSCVFDARYISGGSSSGSSVAVAAGLVTFALGTDTAGSGRIPAGFNNLVGWKPTRGLLSTRGVVPACRSLDCVSVFSLTCDDARAIGRLVSEFDPSDPYSRERPGATPALPASFRFGVPPPSQLEFYGDTEAAALFASSIERLRSLGGKPVEIDFAPFRETAELLYSGPWVAERLAAIQPFFDEHPQSLHPVTAAIIGGGNRYSAVDTFRALYRLEDLRRATEASWKRMDVLLLPTSGTIYTHAELAAEPVQLNTNLGLYTNFVNLLDLCAVAVPAGFRSNGLPFGVTLIGPAFTDDPLCRIGGQMHRALGGRIGASKTEIGSLPAPAPAEARSIHLAVVGAHLTGQPLNGQLTSRGATLVKRSRTAAGYRLFVLSGTVPAKPGLVRSPGVNGPGVELEVWSLDETAFGSFVAEVPPPLVIGTVELTDGTNVKGFLCEPFAVGSAVEITRFGGWLAYLGNVSASGGTAVPHASATR